MDNRNDKSNNEGFTYTYSSKQQEEIKRIRKKYLPPEEDKMELLRRLDQSASQKGSIVSLILGIVGLLVFGLGMSFAMVWTNTLLIPGVIAGIIGIIMLSAAHPVYQHITKREREKIAPEILRLTDELMK